MKKKYFIIFLICITIPVDNIFAAEPLKITLSGTMDQVIFDGKWTHPTEWKQSSQNTFLYENNQKIQLRSAHQDNFIYFLVDFETDTGLDNNQDKAMICLDTQNDKTIIPNENDFCFISNLNGESVVFQGTSQIDNQLRTLLSVEDFIANATNSDENDRYNKVSHSSYEFKIPTDLVGRTNVYGFFLVVYDKESDTFFNWPSETGNQQTFENLNPSKWGEIISPDKTLPEFNFVILAFLPSMFLIVFLSKFTKIRTKL